MHQGTILLALFLYLSISPLPLLQERTQEVIQIWMLQPFEEFQSIMQQALFMEDQSCLSFNTLCSFSDNIQRDVENQNLERLSRVSMRNSQMVAQ